MTKNTTANILRKLFSEGIQVGNIATKRENVQRCDDKETGTVVESNILVDNVTYPTEKQSS